MKRQRLTYSTSVRRCLSFTVMLMAGALNSAHADEPAPTVTAQDFVNLQEGDNPHAGYRRAHAKGVCVTGEFRANGNLSDIASTSLFEPGVTPFTGRFSIAGGNPYAPDLSSPVRSLALNFALSSTNQWRIAMNTPPVMAVTNPHDFYQQIVAIKKGPEAVKAFFSEHPESKDFMAWRAGYSPADSFSGETYHSLNAFYLHDDEGNKQAARWKMVPESAASHDDIDGPDALQQRLAQQLDAAPVIYNWVFTLAATEDDEDNPAVKWPDTRPERVAGQIVITDWHPQLESSCHDLNFDPLVLPDGISATNDPILRARSAAYAESYRRRAREALTGALEGERDAK